MKNERPQLFIVKAVRIGCMQIIWNKVRLHTNATEIQGTIWGVMVMSK
jgi:hypothetical protein